jgi:hypothetical protein
MPRQQRQIHKMPALTDKQTRSLPKSKNRTIRKMRYAGRETQLNITRKIVKVALTVALRDARLPVWMMGRFSSTSGAILVKLSECITGMGSPGRGAKRFRHACLKMHRPRCR